MSACETIGNTGAEERLAASTHKNESSSTSDMKPLELSWIDVSLLMCLWGLVLVCSIISLGVAAPTVFLLIATILIVRNPSNGLLILLLIFYAPAITVGLPNIFTVTASLVLVRTVLMNPASLVGLLLRPSRVLLWAGVFVLFVTIQTMFSDNIMLALTYYKKYLEGIVLLGILSVSIRSSDDLRRVLSWWAIVAGLATLVKAIHIYMGDDTVLYRTMERMFANDAFDLEHRIHIRHGGETGRRFLLPGEEPNYTSASLAFPFAMALAFYRNSRGSSKIFWTVIAGLTAVACVGTYSRSGFLVIALIGGLYLLRGNLAQAVVPLGLLGGVFITAVTLIPSLHKRIFGIGGAVQEGATGRFDLWQQAIDMWLESPVFGSGMSSFYDRYHGAVHNSYLQVLAETGLVGFLLYLMVIVTAVRIGQRLHSDVPHVCDSREIELSAMTRAGLIGFCFMISTVTYQDVKLFWLALGMYAAMFTVSRHTTADQPPPIVSHHRILGEA